MTWVCYLARPIDQANGWDFGTRTIKDALVERGASIYDPGNAWFGGVGAAPQRVNDAALELAGGMLALLPNGIQTIGVPMEIERFVAMGKPVVVLMPGGVRPSSTLLARSVPTFDVPQDAVEELVRRVAYNERRLFRESVEVDVGVESPVGPLTMLELQKFLEDVRFEVQRAQSKHPKTDSHGRSRWFSIWTEEVLEAVQAVNDDHDEEHVRRELVQVAAMTCRLWRAWFDA